MRSSPLRRINDTIAPLLTLLIRANQNGDFKDKNVRILALTVRNVYSLTIPGKKFFPMPYWTVPKRNKLVNLPIQQMILYRLANQAQGVALKRVSEKLRVSVLSVCNYMLYKHVCAGWRLGTTHAVYDGQQRDKEFKKRKAYGTQSAEQGGDGEKEGKAGVRLGM